MALATPGTDWSAVVALRTQFWQFKPVSENSVAPSAGAGAGESQDWAQPQAIAAI
jgi:hypothetical protein